MATAPYILSNKASSIILAAFCAAAAFGGFCDEPERATGLLLPPGRRSTVKVARSAQKARVKFLLGAGAADDLPAKWDSREKGWVTPVRNQGNVGACWAFASYATLETQLLKAGKGEYDFSEKNMVNLHGLVQTAKKEGNAYFSSAYLLRWGGAVAETNDAYMASLGQWKSSVPRNPAIHVQNVVWIPARTSSTDNDALKTAVVKYGAVAVPMLLDETIISSNGSYCWSSDDGPDHLVAVVGWDDDYSRENFSSPPSMDGAWIVKNSWGEDKGDSGYLFVSYCDEVFHRSQSLYGHVFIPATDDENYSAVYGYDRLGPVGYDLTGEGGAIGAVFTAGLNEELAAVGLYSCVPSLDYRISVYTNMPEFVSSPVQGGCLAWQQTGCLTNIGYSTIPLSRPLPIAAGGRFSIVFENTTPCDRFFAVCCRIDGYSPGFTPVSNATFYNSDNSWRDSTANCFYDIYGEGPYCGNICLKAYTRTTRTATDAGPGETADGTKMCVDVEGENPALYAQCSGTFGAFANIVGANSHSLWYSWLTGLDPADEDAAGFTLEIAVTNNIPCLNWTPDLGAGRTYVIYGKTSLAADADWQPIEKSALPETDARFFKVEVAP